MRWPHSNDEMGRSSVLVDASLALPVLIVLIFAVVDVSRIHHTRSRLQNAVSQATQFAFLGHRPGDRDLPGLSLSQEESIARIVRRISGLHDLDSGAIEIHTVHADGSTRRGAGGPGDVVVVRVSYAVPVRTPGLALVFPGSAYRFTCTARYRTEDFAA